MFKVSQILTSDFLAESGDARESFIEKDWSAWLEAHNYDPDLIDLLAQYAPKLYRIGISLDDSYLNDVIHGNLFRLEDAIVITLKTAEQRELVNPNDYFVAVLKSGSRLGGASKPYLPVRTAADFEPKKETPHPHPSRSIEELQADLDKGGAHAIVTCLMIKNNPQWGMKIIDGKIQVLGQQRQPY